MQALLADLLPWVVAFFVLDGLVSLRRGHLLFVRGGGRRRALGPGLHAAGASPFEEAVAAHDLPFLVTERELLFPEPARRVELAVVCDEDLVALPAAAAAQVARDGRTLRIAGRPVLVAPSPALAEELRAEVAAVAAAPEGARVEAFRRREAARLGIDAARARRLRGRPFRAALRAAAAALAVVLLGLGAAAAYAPARAPLPAAAVLAAAGALVVLEVALALALGLASGARGGSVGPALRLLYPVAALHPLAHVTRPLLAGLHPFAVAALLLDRAELVALAGRALRQAGISRARTRPELGAFWDAREAAIAAALAAVGATREEAVALPPLAPDAAAACPLCGTQYRAGFERCQDCDVALAPVAGRP